MLLQNASASRANCPTSRESRVEQAAGALRPGLRNEDASVSQYRKLPFTGIARRQTKSFAVVSASVLEISSAGTVVVKFEIRQTFENGKSVLSETAIASWVGEEGRSPCSE